MSNENEQLSHNDMWDDSVLVDSWNQALEEYKKYHSIHAKGASLEEAEVEVTTEVIYAGPTRKQSLQLRPNKVPESHPGPDEKRDPQMFPQL
ncbi:uncharacterized protein DNG_06169 [Cephalotrichum gorgonifer]|uniref:Survival Motor Neuron Gemin2-binding domain-containing protein n=1 Tax=Cephalotrichum gorgonifer TaxID=2041049 RepID=A0AAE8MZ58_9PEZI|nr:uncharacterized protein DNG_06169 [Cephalotrichum gorgonifer]